mgnify:CR=1 FL=1
MKRTRRTKAEMEQANEAAVQNERVSLKIIVPNVWAGGKKHLKGDVVLLSEHDAELLLENGQAE